MVAEFTYLSLLSVFVIIPSLLVIAFNLKTMVRYKLVILSVFIILPVLWVWDYLATLDRVWVFENILGVWIIGIPVEEVLLFIFLTLFTSSVTLTLMRR